ncbi:MAG TPA: VWA domain-containing protein [Pyrinomonadaceae bacterium]|nr:VWA domain-containing protein [Pyrinomonadaceae bacterium]
MPKHFLLAVAIAVCAAAAAHAQEQRPRTVGPTGRPEAPPGPEEVVRTRTRVVFLDALVKDRKTNEPVRGLRPKDFQVLDDGRPRPLSYFTREGDSRRPLALLLVVDLWSVYGRPHLKSEAALGRLNSALSKLAPEDEVALMTTWIEEGPGGEPVPSLRMVSGFTRDRAGTAAAVLSLPRLVAEQERLLEDLAERRGRYTEDLRLDIVWRLSEIADEVIALTRRFPNSRFVVVGLIDDLFDLRKGEREEVTERALRAGITFNALVFKKSFGTRFFVGTLNKLVMKPRGLSVHAADEIAKQTGGEVAQVGKPQDLTDGLSRFIDDMLARYSLGFTLAESEPDDGRLHALAVKVRARDARGRERGLTVRARRGYYASAP